MRRACFVLAALMVFCALPVMADTTFNGQAEFQEDGYGYYYIVTGGKFPTGNTPNGDNGSGGTFRYLTDDSAWGAYTLGVWHKDDWFPQNAGFALTLKSGGSTVYDNNGIEDGTYGDYYNATAQGLLSTSTPGLYRGYSMSNNYDWIYAGYFKLEQSTTIDTLIGYFDENSGFDRNAPYWKYRMNIWSNVSGDLLPVNTGSFAGDIFSSDTTAGTFSTSDTGVDRVFGTDYNSMTDDIFRLTYSLDTPITLAAGEYWFSHDAALHPIPEPVFFQFGALMGLSGLGVLKLRRR